MFNFNTSGSMQGNSQSGLNRMNKDLGFLQPKQQQGGITSQPTIGNGQLGSQGVLAPQQPQAGLISPHPEAPKATSGLKKTTTTDSQGNTTTHEYHKPESTGTTTGTATHLIRSSS